MDAHPKQDLDAQMSNPEEEEDQYVSGEEEEEEEDLDNEDSSGVNPPSLSRIGDHNNSPPAVDYYRRSSPVEHQEMEERKRLERELLVQKEMLIKREETPLYLGGSNNGRSSKSTTPSPSSPTQTQYLYAANYPFAAAAAAFLTPSHLAAAQAAVQASAVAAAAQSGARDQLGAGAAHSGALPAIGGGGESSTGSATPPNNGTADDQSKYTYEEQFKQLYEITDDPRRREFLDDLFNFMQKRGTPVNRVPIMAKQVLDLYELYRLVVARGGLVEVINKKIWREITKGLNLPSSITSAAFTLRTQYMRYLYAYECDREKLSTAEELQAAIDGNRREGRRSSYGPYGDLVNPGAVAVSRNSQHPPLSSPLSLVSRHVNGHGSTPGGLSSGRGSASPLPLAYFHNNNTSAQLPLNLAHQENGLYGSHNLSSAFNEKYLYSNGSRLPAYFSWNPVPVKKFKDDKMENGISDQSASNHKPNNNDTSRLPNGDSSQDMKPFTYENGGENFVLSGEEDNCNSIPSTPNPMVMPQQEALNLEVSRNSSTTNNNNDQKPLNMKRKPQEEERDMSTTKRLLEDERFSQRSSMPHAHLKISSNRGPDGRLQSDASITISMEVNGILYQGVLYASPNHRNRL